MDGNGRWAKARGLKRYHGHSAGVERVREIVEEAVQIGIEELTLYAFSTENWNRPKVEVDFLMKLFQTYLKKEISTFMENNIQFRVIGDLKPVPSQVRKEVEETIQKTASNDGMILRIALSYGGRMELTEAVQKIAQKVKKGQIEPSEITEEVIRDHLYDPQMHDPDLIIRTSGEYRISNFLLWQSSYSEFWVSTIFWPDFTVTYFRQALQDYQNRERRFGKVPSNK
ncbi:MAG: isoprenyl transferase [Planctomycetota bacterium]|nr:MAG: isoprenyl transferase [Planctomycetota bacterium]